MTAPVLTTIAAARSIRRVLVSQRWSRSRVESWQTERLKCLVRHAYVRVPYYRHRLDEAGISPDSIRSLNDLSRIPVTRKDDIRDLSPDQVTAAGTRLDRCQVKRTSGSSGEPLRIYWDRRQHVTFFAAYVRSHVALGCRLRDRFLLVGPTYYPEAQLPQRLGICRLLRVSPFAGAEAHADALQTFRPDVFESYPSALSIMLRHADTHGTRLHRPRLVTTSGEYLDPETSALAERHFGQKPLQFYGAWEMGRIGNECVERAGMHLNEDLLIPEFLPAEDGGPARRLVLTNLDNFTMPFIRYELGDLVEPVEGPCVCGSPFRRIRMLSARMSEVIDLPDGSAVSALHLTGLMLDLPGVRRFRIVQEQADRITVLVVVDADHAPDALDTAARRMETMLPGVTVRWRAVDSIDPEPSGKHRRFVRMSP